MDVRRQVRQVVEVSVVKVVQDGGFPEEPTPFGFLLGRSVAICSLVISGIPWRPEEVRPVDDIDLWYSPPHTLHEIWLDITRDKDSFCHDGLTAKDAMWSSRIPRPVVEHEVFGTIGHDDISDYAGALSEAVGIPFRIA